MAKKKQQRWEPWPADPRVEYSEAGGGLEIRMLDDDGGYSESTWCKLMGGSVDATVRQLMHEIKTGVY